MAIERLATMAIQVGRRDAVWIGAVVNRAGPNGIQYRYESWWGRRGGAMQTLRTPRLWNASLADASTEYTRVMLEKESEGYEHIEWRSSRYSMRGVIRSLANGVVIPATARTGRTDPSTMLAPVNEAASPHLFSASTLRTGPGEYLCGIPGCQQRRLERIHTSHLSRHAFVRGAGGWCVDCRQGPSHVLHHAVTLRERSDEFYNTQSETWRANGGGGHEFQAHMQYISIDGYSLCTECGCVRSVAQHTPESIQAAWRMLRHTSWRDGGRREHRYLPNGSNYTATDGTLLCETCGAISGSTDHFGRGLDPVVVHAWQQARNQEWADSGREPHDYIPSEYRGNGTGVVLCAVCGFREVASNGTHTGTSNVSNADRILYSELQEWSSRQYVQWAAGAGPVHEFRGERYLNPIKRSGLMLCGVCGLLENARLSRHGSDKPVAPTPHQYEPVVRRRRPEPGF